MPPKNKYTDPELRDEVKEDIQQGDKGGKPGQWSARKAQMMAKEYKKRGGDYNTDKSEQNESQKHLSKWGEEDWQTKEGSGTAKKSDGSRKRYLPKEAWENMSDAEKKATDDKKQEESKEGTQFVGNTEKAKTAGKNARNHSGDDSAESSSSQEQGSNDEQSPSPAGRKRTRGQQKDADKQESNNKKQKVNDGSAKKPSGKSGGKNGDKQSGTVCSKHDSADAPAAQASLDRLPKKGQKAYWKALPGWVDGEVIEVVKTQKKVDGKDVKGSKDEPKIVLKSSKSRKICVHKVNNVYFD